MTTWTHTPEYFVVAKIISFMYLAVIIAVLLLHVYRVLKYQGFTNYAQSNNINSTTAKSKSVSGSKSLSIRAAVVSNAFKKMKRDLEFRKYIFSHIFTFSALAFYSVNTLLYALNTAVLLTPFGPLYISCSVYYKIWILSYHLSKVSIFYLLVLRLKMAYDNSSFSYSKTVIYGLFTLVSVWFLFIFIYDIIIADGHWNDEWKYCQSNFVSGSGVYGLYGTILYDIIINIITLILFIKPLIKLKKLFKTETSNHSNKIGDISELIMRYAILTSVTVLSSFTCLLVAAYSNSGIILLFDNVINSICVILYFIKLHKLLYDKLCCCHILCMKINKIPTQNEKNHAEIAMNEKLDKIDGTNDVVTMTNDDINGVFTDDEDDEIDIHQNQDQINNELDVITPTDAQKATN